jgi:hypothetical protein
MNNELLPSLSDLYLAPRRPSALGGQRKFTDAVPRAKRVQAEEWLKGQDAYTLHKPARVRWNRRPTIVAGVGEQAQADLMDVRSHREANNGITFILTVVDVFSKKAWAYPLRSKSGLHVSEALDKLLTEQSFAKLQTDKGTEFYNEQVRRVLRREGVELFSSENETIKASLVERFNRTLRGKIHRHLTATNGRAFVENIEDMVRSYNFTRHTSTGLAPVEVGNDNQEEVWYRLYERQDWSKLKKKPKLSVGNHVRISSARMAFERGYTPNWSREIFVVTEVRATVVPIVYAVEDLSGETIKGTFYEKELQRVTLPESFRIEKVIKTRRKGRGKEMLVKWLGYPDSFNSWVSEKDFV